ncbi:MAG: PAS domain S-box protein [Nitrospiraceae bacterium]|nr:PAS domain S-box protein [Nitrospiraceae bacterium]
MRFRSVWGSCVPLYVLALFLFFAPSVKADQIPAKKTLTAVIPLDSPPTYFRDSKTGEAAGFAVDVTNAIAQRAGYSIRYKFRNDWTEIIADLLRGSADIAPEMGITEERKNILSFSLPTDTFPVVVFVRTDSTVTSLSDSMNIGVIKGSAAYEIIQKQRKGITPKTYESFQGGLLDLLAGQIDAFCCPAPTLIQLARKAGVEDRIKIVGRPLLELKRAVALRQDDTELLARFNKAIDDFVDTSEYKKIYSRWYGSPAPYWSTERVEVVVGAAVALVVIIMAVWRYFSIVSLNSRLIETKAQLKQSEIFLKTIIETEPECVKLVDAEGTLIMMNKAGLDMIEAESLEQVKGQCVCPLVNSGYRDDFMKLTREVCNGGSGILTFEMTGLKGRSLWLETHGVPFRNEKGEIIALLGITRDITEKIKSEAALKASEENFRTLFDKAADALFMIRPDGIIAGVNEVVCSRYHYTREELIGMSVTSIDSPATAKYAAERIRKIQEDGVAIFEAEHITKDGRIIPTEVNATFIIQGDEPLLLATCRDITERKRAEDALACEKERLAVTLKSIGDGVIATDISGTILTLNKVAETLTGWSAEEATGRPLTEVFNIINETTRERCDNPVEKVIRTGLIIGLANHTALIRKDGTEVIIADSAAPIRDSSSITIGVVLVFRDVTEQYRMEQEMHKMQKLESLGVLAGGLAHDFNNLLTSIIGNVSLTKMLIGTDNKAFQRLTEAEKAAQRAADLTHQLLTFSKGGAPIKKIASIPEITREAVTFALSGSNVTCVYSIPTHLWSAEVDKGQMNQVFNNLIINAIQAMPGGGTVHVDFQNVTLAEEEVTDLHAGHYIRVTFADGGNGIPEEYIGKIFDPYFTTKKTGSGLGLATVFSILKRHGGSISVKSAVGAGTTFTIHIPALRDTVNPEHEETGGIKEGRGKILVMDDEELVRNVSGDILTALGYEVSFARDGKEAIDLYRREAEEGNPFHLVIMDLTIPAGLGGKEAVTKLHEIDPYAKIIVSSGYSSDPIMSDYKKYGFCGVINKPYNANQVSEVVNNALKA